MVPLGSSRTTLYLGFQKKILFGFKFSLIFTTVEFLSRMMTSMGTFIPKVCTPNLVSKVTG